MPDFDEADFQRSSRGARGETITLPKPKGPSKPPAPTFKLESKPFPANNAAPGEGPHKGTGRHSDLKQLIYPWTVGVDGKLPLTAQLRVKQHRYAIRVMSFELTTGEAPNWFGVSFREGIQSFDSVNIFCHPNPQNAHMFDKDYGSRGGNWTRLFRYAQMFGIQMHAAESNLVTIIPFFNNATYGNTGVFGPNWQNIIEQILAAVRKDVGAGAKVPFAGVKHVVLSDFSRGRDLMQSVRVHARGLSTYLREIWDFDGVGGSAPTSGGSVRVIHYDQHEAVSDANNFHVPPKLWVEFHGPDIALPGKSVHSNIPDMLGWHAAEVSKVGRAKR
jgi:hypothetical protein